MFFMIFLRYIKVRYRRTSPSRGDSSPSSHPGVNADRVSHVKSPVTSEGQEEWETASESSDIGERQKYAVFMTN